MTAEANPVDHARTAESAATAANGSRALEPVEQSFADAARASGRVVERDYAIAGCVVRLRSASAEMLQRLSKAFSHLNAPAGAAPEFTIHLWDSASGSTAGPANARGGRRAGSWSVLLLQRSPRADWLPAGHERRRARPRRVSARADSRAERARERARTRRGTGSPTPAGSPTGSRRRRWCTCWIGGCAIVASTCSMPVPWERRRVAFSWWGRAAPASRPRHCRRSNLTCSATPGTTTSACRSRRARGCTACTAPAS